MPLFPESAHYLVVSGRMQQAKAALVRSAKINGLELADFDLQVEADADWIDDHSLMSMVKQGVASVTRYQEFLGPGFKSRKLCP